MSVFVDADVCELPWSLAARVLLDVVLKMWEFDVPVYFAPLFQGVCCVHGLYLGQSVRALVEISFSVSDADAVFVILVLFGVTFGEPQVFIQFVLDRISDLCGRV